MRATAGCVKFDSEVTGGVTEIPYVTLTAAFILSTFLILAASLIVIFIVDELNRSGQKILGDKVDNVCRWLFPVGYASMTALLVLIFFSLP